MKALQPELNSASATPLYEQLYDYIRSEISKGTIGEFEVLPSLRALSETLGISITTCRSAYDQLVVEGYIESRPNSGFYVRAGANSALRSAPVSSGEKHSGDRGSGARRPALMRDPDTFDFVKWKKCYSKVINEGSGELLSPADSKGEYELRAAISEYLYSARGVTASPDEIVIAAGVQQLTSHLARILALLGFDLINTEDPGYEKVKKIFLDRGFSLNGVPVNSDGIDIARLPSNIKSCAYVSPSNQFPTGAVMPVSKRRELLDWASANGSLVIEDDYDSELRYFGRPIPALKSLDTEGLVVYLGSFSSTLFPAIRISYMVLPRELSDLFDSIKNDYDQTCSKAEQLALANFMNEGYYRSGIRKLRKLCSKKLELMTGEIERLSGSKGKGVVLKPVKTWSGLHLHLKIERGPDAERLCEIAGKLGARALPMTESDDSEGIAVFFDQIPIGKITDFIRDLINESGRKMK